MTQRNFLILTFIGFVTGGCERIEYFPDRPVRTMGPLMIAHKGGGYFDEGNTMEACIHGLTFMDGIEVDIQMTSDEELWLQHSSKLLGCGDFDETCFDLVSSDRVAFIDNCLGATKDYVRLESIFKIMQQDFPGKYISLDVKAWSPCGARGLNIIHEMNQLAQSILDLTAKYQLEDRVLVESEVGDFLYYLEKRKPRIETYLASLGDLELGLSRALDGGFDGISFHYKFDEPLTREMVNLMHRKGLKIQLWTVNEPEDIEEARSIGADFIQTDNF